jgi:hypothetical protein
MIEGMGFGGLWFGEQKAEQTCEGSKVPMNHSIRTWGFVVCAPGGAEVKVLTHRKKPLWLWLEQSSLKK